MYPSDFGYATAGSKGSTSQSQCRSMAMYDWNNNDCNNWMSNQENMWTIMPLADSMLTYFVINISNYVHSQTASWHNNIFPVVYLKPDVLVSSGNGSQESPYVLSGN